MRQLLTERYRERLAGVLSCYDRIVITGTLPGACYAGGMTRFLSARQIQIFDYPRFAEPLRDRVRERAAELAGAAGIAIEHIAKSHIRKEDVVAKVLAVRISSRRWKPATPTSPGTTSNASHLLAAGYRQMPALLLLLHGRRVGPDLSAGASAIFAPMGLIPPAKTNNAGR